MRRLWLRLTVPAVLLLLIMGLITGCRKQEEENGRTNKGVEDGIGGFLYNFDQRSEVATLVKNQKSDIYPSSVTWYYEKEGGTAREVSGEVQSNLRTSTDRELIKELYYALANVIIVGISVDQSKYTHYLISFEMPGGEECRFNFVSENTIRLSGQNYVVETDGTLWKALLQEAKTQDAQDEKSTEGLSEAEEFAEMEEVSPQELVTEEAAEEETVTEEAAEETAAEEVVTEEAVTEEAVTEEAAEETVTEETVKEAVVSAAAPEETEMEEPDETEEKEPYQETEAETEELPEESVLEEPEEDSVGKKPSHSDGVLAALLHGEDDTEEAETEDLTEIDMEEAETEDLTESETEEAETEAPKVRRPSRSGRRFSSRK